MPGDTKLFAMSVINDLQLKEGSMLVAIVWAIKISRRRHRLRPQVLGRDAKKRANDEKRPMARFTDVDVEGFNLPHA